MILDEELIALRKRVAELEDERDQLRPIYEAHLEEEQRSVERREGGHLRVATLTEHELHLEQLHPDYEYAMTENVRRSGEAPLPQGVGWEPNDRVEVVGASSRWRNWIRDEFTETNYWRRRKPVKEQT